MALDGVLADRYELGEILGQGTTATVYRAHDRLLDRAIALKAIHMDLGDAAGVAEARAAARVSHPNVVTIHDVLEDAGDSYIAMELLEGPTLAQELSQRPLSPQEAFRVICDIAAALEAAHANQVVHCDIKPDNIFVAHAGRVVVTDFGLANPELGGGTPGYMAPEQYDGEDPSPAMDVFGWGCVAVEVISGEPPFGLGQEEAQYRTRFEAPRGDLRSVEAYEGLHDLILKTLEKRPRDRPPDGAELLEALAAIARGTPPTTIPTPRSMPPTAPADFPPAHDAAPVPGPAMRLLVYPPDREAWIFDLREGEHIDIGREATLVVDDPQASRQHAQLWFNGAQVLVTDLGSMNGTMVNGAMIAEFLASPGDEIAIGSTLIHLEYAY